MDNREANSNRHPPACTCVDCVNRRLGITKQKIRNTRYNEYHDARNRQNADTPKLRYVLIPTILIILVIVYVVATSNNVNLDTIKSAVQVGQNSPKQEVPNNNVVDKLLDKSVVDYASKFNQYRQSKGLASLEFTDDLNQIASRRLEELKTDFSHTSAGNYNQHLAENIVESKTTIEFVFEVGTLGNQQALEMWKGSPGHNANMLDVSYKYTGYAIGGGYAVQLFSEFKTINGVPQLPPGYSWR